MDCTDIQNGIDEKLLCKMLEKETLELYYDRGCICSFTAVSNSFSGLEATEATYFDLIFVHNKLTHLSAVHFINILRKVGCMTPIVQMVDGAKETLARDGFCDVLNLPYSAADIQHVIHHFLDSEKLIHPSNIAQMNSAVTQMFDSSMQPRLTDSCYEKFAAYYSNAIDQISSDRHKRSSAIEASKLVGKVGVIDLEKSKSEVKEVRGHAAIPSDHSNQNQPENNWNTSCCVFPGATSTMSSLGGLDELVNDTYFLHDDNLAALKVDSDEVPYQSQSPRKRVKTVHGHECVDSMDILSPVPLNRNRSLSPKSRGDTPTVLYILGPKMTPEDITFDPHATNRFVSIENIPEIRDVLTDSQFMFENQSFSYMCSMVSFPNETAYSGSKLFQSDNRTFSPGLFISQDD